MPSRCSNAMDAYGIPEDYWGELVEEAARELKEAAGAYPNKEQVLFHLYKAFEKAGKHITVLIGFYRFYFYQSDLLQSIYWGRLCMEETAKKLRINENWMELTEDQIEMLKSAENPLVDLYLRAFHAVAYLLGRVGNKEEALKMLQLLTSLDVTNQIGARRLATILKGEDNQ
ncbi:hypothetical protein A7Q09_00965 [Methylacidiphilum sp. Yel]|uniref:hypothetical protein n=1 Tax=Methylacidiphilum sp. Yel TaxID=1847730 RepID=UPI00106D8401|nr:hypothetical protein [Methylacidiphilum sp. Yel]TFE68833.1 hypothetical protein A7Q09_00965 [Methylacidiphilum sp. Yel]